MSERLNRQWRLIFLGMLSVVLSSCGSVPDGDDYLTHNPSFNLTEFFSGEVFAWGLVQNRSGKVVQRFRVQIQGEMQNKQLVLNERFFYDLGEGPEQRIWYLTPQSATRWTGKASDIIGHAEGILFGNALNWRYQMDLPVGERTFRVHFDDWMWAMDKNTLFNRTKIKKFGFTVAEVTIFMQKNHLSN